MYTFQQNKKMTTYEWFCGPGLHIWIFNCGHLFLLFLHLDEFRHHLVII